MQIAKVYVNELEARTIYGKKITKGLRGGKVSLEYAGGIWGGLVKSVAFTNGLKTVGVLNAGLEVEIPPEVTDTAGVEIMVGVCGVDGTGIVIPTIWANLGEVLEAAPADFEEADKELTPSVTEQLLSLIGPMDELGTDAKDSLVAAINEILRLAGGDIDPEAIAEALAEYLAANPIQETDPTVPAWAKQPTKPEYTAEEVGAQIANCVIYSNYDMDDISVPYSEIERAEEAGATLILIHDGMKFDYVGKDDGFVFERMYTQGNKLVTSRCYVYGDNDGWYLEEYGVMEPTSSVTSVNGKTGVVALTAGDVGALPDTTKIPTVPTKVSAFTNDAGYLTEVPEGYAKTTDVPTDAHINQLINTALGVIENGTY